MQQQVQPQVQIPRVSLLPNLPSNFKVVDWRGKGLGQQQYFFGRHYTAAEKLESLTLLSVSCS